MSGRSLLLGVLVMVVSLPLTVIVPPSHARSCVWAETGQMIDGLIEVTGEWICTSPAPPPQRPGTRGEDVRSVLSQAGRTTICSGEALRLGRDPLEVCPPPEAESATPSPDLVQRAVRRLPIPPSELVVQPPNGRTLVNFETNFFTTTGQPAQHTILLLGRAVDVGITPSRFHWHFGQGHTATTETPGAPYPDLQVTHRYLTAEPVRPRVDVVYTATYRVAGEPWRAVPGSVTVPGAAVDLDVIEARPRLVPPG